MIVIILDSNTVIYDVTDSAGNASIQVTRTVDVVDTQSPVITLNGITPITLQAGVDTYTEDGATVTDNDPAYSGTVTIGGDTVDANTVGTYIVTYDAPSDQSGNAADKQDKIEILQDMIQVLKISIGESTPAPIPVEFQDNLLLKSIDRIEDRIHHWDSKIMKLYERADNLDDKAAALDERAAEKREQGKDRQADRLEARADKLEAKADALIDKAQVFEDLNEVLKVAIDYLGESPLDDTVNPEDDSEDDSMFS